MNAVAVKTFWYKVPFVKGDECEWMDIEVLTDRFADLRHAIAMARLSYGLSSSWKVDFDGVITVDHPAPF